jgi:hypothetical protein
VLSLTTFVMDYLLDICSNFNIILGIAYLLIYRYILRLTTALVFTRFVCNESVSTDLSVFYSSASHHVLNIINPYPANVENTVSRWQVRFKSVFKGLTDIYL